MTYLNELSSKNYSKFFGENLANDILDLVPELQEAVNKQFGLEAHPVLHNFLHHLSSPLMHDPKVKNSYKLLDEEGHSIEHIKTAGLAGLAHEMGKKGVSNPHQHMRAGFHAAFPEHEDEATTKKKAGEAQKHFRQFMHERGGHAKNNTAKIYGGNHKTRSSAGANYKTTGISLSPSKESGYKHDLCPKASSECRKSCLGLTAGGNQRYPVASARAKLLRTQYVHEHPEHAARLMDHELTHHEKASEKVKSYKVGDKKFYDHKDATHHAKKTGQTVGKGEHEPHHPGVRNNVTSDIAWEHMMPKKYYEKHHKSTFYDYTKIPGRLHDKNRPSNYHLALSHTGANHPESNDKDVAHALHHGHVVAMVHQKPKKGEAPATHVHDVASGKHYKIADGDKDDNVFDRHHAAGVDKSEGVVSGLKLKGVKNESAGKFANHVDHKHYEGKPKDAGGVIHINHPKDHPDHWSHHPEKHEAHYHEHPEKFTRKHKDDKNPFHILNKK